MDEVKINAYRKNNNRCRTCRFAQNSKYFWFCSAKEKLYHESSTEAKLCGIFCGLYEQESLVKDNE